MATHASSTPTPQSTTVAAEQPSPPPPLSPEEIADNIMYALEVHERQLRELRKKPDELRRLRFESMGAPLAGYTKTPGLDERDRFFAIMKACCEREPKNEFEEFERVRAARAIISVSRSVDLCWHGDNDAYHRMEARLNEGFKRLGWLNIPTTRCDIFIAPGSGTLGTLWPPEPPFDERGLIEPLARPSGTISTRRITPEELAEFRRDPRLLYGKQFLYVGYENLDNDDSDGSKAPSQNGLLYEITKYSFCQAGHFVSVRSEGCRYPNDRPLAQVFECISVSDLVEQNEG